ncbi:PREDICTED: transcription factor RelB, partial [Charadrius vociferus]|uniref:transcription factor RelB n=1 Tax=Charadrius vociferus TaxID=50402 RepID=UPI00052181DC
PQLLNCHAIPEVKVTACLVWKDWPYRVHPHGLVGKDCSNGLCEVVLKPQTNPKHSFSNLGIQCVKKKEIEAAIEKKLQLGIDPFKAGSLKNHQEVDMNVVRICFQASYKDGSGQTRHLSPVLSEPIFDKKSTNTSELRICMMNKESGPCTGGEELYLLCDKVQKEDIAVVSYQHLELAEPVEVEVFLQRLTDSVCSESFRFTYLPKDHGREQPSLRHHLLLFLLLLLLGVWQEPPPARWQLGDARMWHEARKHERKLRGMMVDYKKRAERRREYYEKIVSVPDLLVIPPGGQRWSPVSSSSHPHPWDSGGPRPSLDGPRFGVRLGRLGTAWALLRLVLGWKRGG